MALIRSKIRQLPVTKEDLLTVLNREWKVVLSAAEQLLNARMGTVVSVSADYIVQAGDQVVLVDSSAGSVTVTLPSAADTQMRLAVKKVAASNTVSIQAGSGDTLYDGSATLSADKEVAEYVAGDTVWYRIGKLT